MDPIEGSKRIETLDFLRGFALLGIILVNILALLSIRPPKYHTLDAFYQKFLYLFVEGRFYTIFSFLFGIGFYLFISRAYQKGENGIALFLRRLMALLVFGIIHLRFHPGEALTVYAICGLVILPFYKQPKQVNLVMGIIMLLVLAVFSIKIFMTLPLMLLGIASGQYRVFEVISVHTRKVVIFTGSLFFFSILALIFQIRHAPAVLWAGNKEATQHYLDIGVAVGPIISAFYAGLLLLLLQIPVLKKLLFPVKQFGRMALTNYLLQTVLLLLARALLKPTGHITYIQSLYLCMVISALQMTFSTIWLHYFQFGPIEWIWRILTYKKVPPMVWNHEKM